MSWKVTTEPTVEPVSLDEAKNHLKIDDFTDDDTLITSLITTARQWCEGFQNRAFITQTITVKLDKFPSGSKPIRLPQPPASVVTSITYIDVDGDTQTLAASVYDVDTSSEPARIALAYNQSWPSIRGDINSVTIVFVAGYGAAAGSVPGPVKQAMLLLIGHFYEHREAVVDGVVVTKVPLAVESLLSMSRTGAV